MLSVTALTNQLITALDPICKNKGIDPTTGEARNIDDLINDLATAIAGAVDAYVRTALVTGAADPVTHVVTGTLS